MDTYEDTKKPINNTNLMKTGSLQKFNVMTESKPNYKQHSLTRLPWHTIYIYPVIIAI
jgi:hypothetical protein